MDTLKYARSRENKEGFGSMVKEAALDIVFLVVVGLILWAAIAFTIGYETGYDNAKKEATLWVK